MCFSLCTGDVENTTFHDASEEECTNRILGEITNHRRTRSPSQTVSPWLQYARRLNLRSNSRYNLRRTINTFLPTPISPIRNLSPRGQLIRAAVNRHVVNRHVVHRHVVNRHTGNRTSMRSEINNENRSTAFSPGRRGNKRHHDNRRVSHRSKSCTH